MPGFGALPPLNQLRVFEAAARHESFTKAGRELHLTQSAVSQQIKSLEAHVGQPLFVRGSRSIELTDAGRAYLPVVQRALDELASGTTTVFGQRDQLRVTLQVNLSFAVYWLAPRLAGFIDAHPDITLDVVTVIHEPERTAATADVEIRFDEHVADAELLCRTSSFPVCSAARAGSADWRVDRLFETAGMRVGWRTWLAQQGESLPPPQRVHIASTHVIGLGAAEHAGALAMALDVFADGAIADGRLARPFDHVSPTPERYWLVGPHPGRRSDASDALRTWLLDQATQAPQAS